MKASQIQQVLKSQAGVLTKLYSEYRTLRAARQSFNRMVDIAVSESVKAHYEGQAAVYTPYIRKLKVKIANLENAQKALKLMLGHAQAIESFSSVEDTFWLQQAASAQDEGYVWTGSGEEFLAKLEEAK
jgi:hypothetical protein